MVNHGELLRIESIIWVMKYIMGINFANNLIMICWSKFGQQIVTLFLAQNGASPTHDTHETSPLKSNLKTNGGGQVDYKKVSIKKWLPI